MHCPLASVSVLAQFSLQGATLESARNALSNESDWSTWINQVELHGLSGFANKHLAEHDLPVPDSVVLQLKALKIRHQSASKARFKVLTEIDNAFQENEVSYVALKGAALVPLLYPENYLRPMRDMDLLLPKSVTKKAADVLRNLGFKLPEEQPSQFMRDMHQLPNAEKQVGGFTCSVELHHDAISREVKGHLYYPESDEEQQTIEWQGLRFRAFDDVTMLHQVCRHLEGLHPGAALKLINVMDVVGLAMRVLELGKWLELERSYPHVLNSLRCLHLLTQLPEPLEKQLAPLSKKKISGIGEIMGSLRNALVHEQPFVERVRLLFRPSDWWLHLYYNVDPDQSLFLIKWFKHPLRVMNWLSRRLYSRLLGG